MKASRQHLYEEVWAEPMRKVALRYEVSDVALRKVCIKLGIPLPPPGMWARLQHGYKVTRTPLPTRWNGPTEADVGSRRQLVSARVQEPEEQVITIDAFDQPRHAFTEAQVSSGRKKPAPAPAASLLHLLPETLHERALNIVSAFCHACDARKIRFEIEIHEELYHFALFPTESSVAIRFVDAGLRPGQRQTEKAAPRMAIRMLRRWEDDRELRSRWEDRKDCPLESQANGIFALLLSTSGKREDKRLAAIEEKRRYAQAVLDQRMYEWKVKALNAHLEQWERAMRLRGFAEHLRRNCDLGHEGLRKWLDWLDRVADSHDPAKGSPEGFLKAYTAEWLQQSPKQD